MRRKEWVHIFYFLFSLLQNYSSAQHEESKRVYISINVPVTSGNNCNVEISLVYWADDVFINFMSSDVIRSIFQKIWICVINNASKTEELDLCQKRQY